MAQYDDIEAIRQSAAIDAELDRFINANPIPAPDWSDLNKTLAVLRARGAGLPQILGPAPKGVKESDITYPCRDGATVRAKLYQPETPPADGSPFILIFHGGGYCSGIPEAESVTARNLVLECGAACVSATYRLAPEHPFPFAVNDAWDALQWAASNMTHWNANPSQGFIVAGTSVGGTLAAICTHMARDHGLAPQITGNYLSIMSSVAPDAVPDKHKDHYMSLEQNKDAPGLTKATVDALAGEYQADSQDGERYSILNHPKGHHGLPPAVFVVCGLDPMRDDALIYERVMRTEYGVKTKLYMYPGLAHAFWSRFPTIEKTQQFRRDQVEAFKWLLDGAR